MSLRTVQDVCNGLFRSSAPKGLPRPPYIDNSNLELSPLPSTKVCLAVESMRRHMTDEGWQIMEGLSHNGYRLVGHGLDFGQVDVPTILQSLHPTILVLQDKREWDFAPGDFRDPNAAFTRYQELAGVDNIFKVTVLKDSHQRPEYHRQSAEEIGCHAWIIYYHPKIVQHLATYVRPEHLIRTYHSINPDHMPITNHTTFRYGCILSGAISGAYPFRTRLVREKHTLPMVDYLPHPGYHRNGCQTPQFLERLYQYKVAICTSSIYGYALRKIIEATACGCVVVTDLPSDEVLPEIDGNLVRVSPNIEAKELGDLLTSLYRNYSPDLQRSYAEKALLWYNYKEVGKRLASDIETLRVNYDASL